METKVSRKKKKRKQQKVQLPVMDQVRRMSDLDSANFGKLDAEIRNAMQGLKLADYEINEIRFKAAEKITLLELNKKKLQSELDRMQPQYKEMVGEIAKKHGIDDPEHLILDPDSGIVRDARDLVKKNP